MNFMGNALFVVFALRVRSMVMLSERKSPSVMPVMLDCDLHMISQDYYQIYELES